MAGPPRGGGVPQTLPQAAGRRRGVAPSPVLPDSTARFELTTAGRTALRDAGGALPFGARFELTELGRDTLTVAEARR